MIFIWLIVFGLLVYMLYYTGDIKVDTKVRMHTKRILQDRLRRGDITKEEYEDISSKLY